MNRMRYVRKALVTLTPKQREPIIQLFVEWGNEMDSLADLLEKAQEHVCSADCPSTGRVGTPIPHNELCKSITQALAKFREGK